MNYYVISEGLIADGKTSCSEALQALLDRIPDNSTIVFPTGDFFFPQTVKVLDKKNLTLQGTRGTRLISHFTPWGDPKDNNDLFNFNRCADITVSDFTITTDNPIGWAGVVTAVNNEEHYYEVRIYDEFPVTGKEHPVALNCCDAEGTPDYLCDVAKWRDNGARIEMGSQKDGGEGVYASFDYTVIGDHLVRFAVPDNADISRLPIGEQMCYRFIIYGSTDFWFANTDRVLLRNIEIERASSVGLYIAPRCSDFTLDHFCIRLRPDTKALYAGNADGIHIRGLTGYFKMYDCHFNGLGDDALNIHGTAGEVIEADGNRFVFRHRNWKNEYHDLDGNWAMPGDVIIAYDPATFHQRGKILVESWDGVNCVGKVTEGEIAVGDALANSAYFAATHLRGCTAKNTRARGFLLQTQNVIVEDCHVWGMSLPAIILAPDIRVWFEVGPSENVIIRNNLFEKCAFIKYGANLGAIVVKGSHDVGAADYPAGVHRHMLIENNTFRGMGNSGIYVSATEDITVRGNYFDGCGTNFYDPANESVKADIVLCNCSDIHLENNTTTKPADRLFYPIGCEEA